MPKPSRLNSSSTFKSRNARPSEAEASDGLRAELHGDLAAILHLTTVGDASGKLSGISNSKNPRSRYVPEGLLSVVAGARFERATFRL